MIKKNNRKCVCCQTEYYFCPNCSDYDTLPRWMTIFHDENCREIFNTVSSYCNNVITKDQAKKRLDKCDLSNKHTFKDSIKSKISEIYRETLVEAVEKEIAKEAEKEIVEETVMETEIVTEANNEFVSDLQEVVVENIVEEPTENVKIAEQRVSKKKKNYKKNIELVEE